MSYLSILISSVNSLLQDVRFDNQTANRRQEIYNNASNIASKLNHKEMMQAMYN